MADYNLTETGKGPYKEGQPITVLDQTKNKTQTNKQNKQKQQRHPVITSKKNTQQGIQVQGQCSCLIYTPGEQRAIGAGKIA